MKYLGFLQTRNGSWDKYYDVTVQKARGTVAQSYTLFNSREITFQNKIEIARTIVLSLLNYGQDIISLSSSQRQRLESLLGKTLRAVLNQPRRSKTAALQIIAGQQTIVSQFESRRLQNLIRIQALPDSSFLKKFIKTEKWIKEGHTTSALYRDLKKAMNITNYDNNKEYQRRLAKCRAAYNKDETKKTVQEIFRIDSHENLKREIQISHSAPLLRIHDSPTPHPIMKRKGIKSSAYITWMTSSTDLHEDNHELKHQEDICRLCKQSDETKQHLLTNCAATVELLFTYMEEIKLISKEKHTEFINQKQHDRWLWILGGGVTPKTKKI